jgi:hypothetical protein
LGRLTENLNFFQRIVAGLHGAKGAVAHIKETRQRSGPLL